MQFPPQFDVFVWHSQHAQPRLEPGFWQVQHQAQAQFEQLMLGGKQRLQHAHAADVSGNATPAAARPAVAAPSFAKKGARPMRSTARTTTSDISILPYRSR